MLSRSSPIPNNDILTDDQIRRLKETLTKTAELIRDLEEEVPNLPASISGTVELVCEAIDDLITAESQVFRSDPSWDTHRTFRYQAAVKFKKYAIRKLRAAVSELAQRRQDRF